MLQLKDHKEAPVLSGGSLGPSLHCPTASSHRTCPISGLHWGRGTRMVRCGWPGRRGKRGGEHIPILLLTPVHPNTGHQSLMGEKHPA